MPQWLLLTLEIVGCALFVAGMWLFWHPGAFLVAGTAIVVACERWSIAETARRQAQRR
ncbi:MAG: hypothetical protein JWO11_3617 [Nocardioides sp.]|nr:hypothetical protein [Nocardioides sp.]